MSVSKVLEAIEVLAPAHLAYEDDPIGLQVGRKSDPVTKCVVSLDPSVAAMKFAESQSAQLLIAHHPLVYHPLKSLAGDSSQMQALRTAISANIAVIAAHTNWDAAEGGINDALATVLGLKDITKFGNSGIEASYKLVAFVPPSDAEMIIDALSKLGCGEIGLYRRCASVGNVQGTFEPMPGANPVIGEVGNRETVDELRIEMRVPARLRQKAEIALRDSHPYDEPAYDFYLLSNTPAQIGRVGKLPGSATLADFAASVESKLQTSCRAFGDGDAKIRSVAIIGGAGGSYWLSAKMAGADLLLTGEVKHHEALAASESGFCLIEAGHYATEQPGAMELGHRLAAKLPEIEFIFFEPGPGAAARPG
ncbi:MAG: Nif3-like dinuclear metal center hexameric protein [Fimbriimonadales bacterium]